MKALEKDRTRRYETASTFAADILRYLHYEPVEAGPPSARYRLKKLACRYRPVLVTASRVCHPACRCGDHQRVVGLPRKSARDAADRARLVADDQRKVAEIEKRRADANATAARQSQKVAQVERD